jgi:tRNA wybutosine-synthesizing protein 3
MITFERRKQDCLTKSDKSSIGELDKHIVSLCEKINKNKNYYTLSSCAGRVVLIKNSEEKTHDLFIFRSHEKISFSELKKEIDKIISSEFKEAVIFKQEPVILHVACKTLEDASNLLKKVQAIGMKHSGIMTIAGNRIVVEIIESSQLALPIIEKGKLLVDDDFLKILVRESNFRLEKSWSKIEALEKVV